MPRLTLGGKSFVSFYDKGDMPYYDFANYSLKPLKIKENGLEIVYRTPEHYFQAQKIVHNDPVEQHRLRKEFNQKQVTPDQARVGIKTDHPLTQAQINSWNNGGAVTAMLNVIRARCKEDLAFKQLLDNTKNEPIVEDTVGLGKRKDDIWGCGLTGNGTNLLGICLMQVREENRSKDASAARKIADDLYAEIQKLLVNHLQAHPRPDGKLLQNNGVELAPAQNSQAPKPPQPPQPPQPTRAAEIKSTPLPPSLSAPDKNNPPAMAAMEILGKKADQRFLVSYSKDWTTVSEIKTNATFKDCNSPEEKTKHIKKLESMILAFQAGRPRDQVNSPILITGTDPDNRAILAELCKLHHLPYQCKDSLKANDPLHNIIRKVADESFHHYKNYLPEKMQPMPEKFNMPNSGLRYLKAPPPPPQKPEPKTNNDGTEPKKDLATQLQEKKGQLKKTKSDDDDNYQAIPNPKK